MKKIVCLVLLLAGIAIAPANAQSNKAREDYVKGLELYNSKKYEEALTSFNKAIDRYGNYMLAHLYAGYCHYELNQHTESIRAFTAVIDWFDRLTTGHPDNDPEYRYNAYAYRGWSYISGGNKEMDKALADFNKAIELQPNWGYAYNGRGYAHFLKEDYTTAIQNYTRAINNGYNNNYVYCNRADAYYSKSFFWNAAEDYNTAITKNNSFNYYFTQRTRCYYYAGKFSEAIKSADETLNRMPYDSNSMQIKARALHNSGNYVTAIDAYTQFVNKHQLSPEKKFQINSEMADCYLQTRQYKKAAQAYQQVYEWASGNSLPDYQTYVNNLPITQKRYRKLNLFPELAKSYYGLGDYTKAMAWLDSSFAETALQADKLFEDDRLESGIYHAILLMRQNSHTAAINKLKEVLSSASLNLKLSEMEAWQKKYYALVQTWLAVANALKEDYDQSLLHATRADAVQPSKLNQAILAFSWSKKGNKTFAKKALDQLQNFTDKSREADYLAAFTYIQIDSFPAAIDAYRRFALNTSDNYSALSDCYKVDTLVAYCVSKRNLQQTADLLKQLLRAFPQNDQLLSLSLQIAQKINEYENETFPPRIKIIEPADYLTRSIEIGEDEEVNIIGTVEDESPIAYVKINGRKVYVNAEGIFSHTVMLDKEINDFTIEASDSKNNIATRNIAIRSKTSTKQIINTTSAKRYHALLIGVSKQQDGAIEDIATAVDDVRQLRSALVKNFVWDTANIQVLINPKREELLNSLEAACVRLSPEDNLLIFYAGHGTYLNAEMIQQGYWLPYDAKKGKTATYVSNTDIKERIGRSKAKHVLLVSDACFSGSIFRSADLVIKDVNYNRLFSRMSRKAITSGDLETVPGKSVFIEHFVNTLNSNQQPYISANEIFSKLATKVAQATNNKPRYGIILQTGGKEEQKESGDFIFIRK